jgi:hypothetical protein
MDKLKATTSLTQGVTESRVVLYRWHPWSGRSAYIFGAFTKGEQAVFRCTLEPADVARSLEVPQWMFDAAACCRVALVEAASVNVETLRAFDRLLCAVKGVDESGVLQAEHPTLPDAGGACATPKRSRLARSADDVSSAADYAAVGEHSGRSSRTDGEAACSAPTVTSPLSTGRAAGRAGGVR